ncbi:MAG: PKD domain-containing protein [Thermoplasmatota archaeon]
MFKGLKLRDIAIVGVILIIAIGAAGYFLFIRDDDKPNDDDNGNGSANKRPTADAGLDIVVISGEEFTLNGSGSFDPDGDELIYSWDLDLGTDANSDGIPDNDRDIIGKEVTSVYVTQEEITYIVTLNVTDTELSDTDTVRVTVLPNEDDEPPEITMSCRYQSAIPPYLEAHFIITIEEVTDLEFISYYTYRLEDVNGGLILNGSVSDLILMPPNATIRFIDAPNVTYLSANDMFYIKERGEISEGSTFYLFYNDLRERVGEIELTK